MSPPASVTLSVLDRLRGGEGPRVARIRDGIRQDLQDLLNTPNRVIGWSQALDQLDTSILNYGIMDLCTANLSTEQQRAAVVEEIGRMIRLYEPRLSDMRIHALANADPSDRSLRLRIEARIYVENEVEPIIFNTVVDPVLNAISLSSATS
ncbi:MULTISPECIES: type VI secretion system baseplate subunit TssE [Azorhizobium]|uniref:type VI secretion system baseplate subunit TssE n=1 Tax=Azorhizobium TaxID=6 RepID=UPI001060C550|nr:type VI secretion system baseplate subunit TssE [Azorhizobium sp. AG788]TDT99767.1 type VI secretion system protein ImpF [Azorhizobium sp. AG788]